MIASSHAEAAEAQTSFVGSLIASVAAVLSIVGSSAHPCRVTAGNLERKRSG